MRGKLSHQHIPLVSVVSKTIIRINTRKICIKFKSTLSGFKKFKIYCKTIIGVIQLWTYRELVMSYSFLDCGPVALSIEVKFKSIHHYLTELTCDC